MGFKKPASTKKKSTGTRQWIDDVLEAINEEVVREDASNSRRKLVEKEYSGDDTFAHELREIVQALLQAPRIETVWQALERRSDPNAVTRSEDAYRKGLESVKARSADENNSDNEARRTLSSWCLERELRVLRGIEENFDRDVGRHIYDMAYDLIGAITEIRSEPVPMDTARRRREKLLEVTELTNRLKRAIEPFYSNTRQYVNRHFTQSSALDTHAIEMANNWIEPHGMGGFCEIDKESVAVAYQVAKNIARHPSSTLDAIVADVSEWANETPELAKPNDPNAERLFFIRKLTAYFRQIYGSPLRGCVLAITEAFFDCGSLDEAAIAKLAP